jgi:hypothetical protein
LLGEICSKEKNFKTPRRQDAKEDENCDFFGLKTYLPWRLGGEKIIAPGFHLEFSLMESLFGEVGVGKNKSYGSYLFRSKTSSTSAQQRPLRVAPEKIALVWAWRCGCSQA